MKKVIKGLILSLSLASFMPSFCHSAATFSRLKSWVTGEILTASDLNAEFDNIINNLDPSGINDYSSNATEMQSVVAPYPSSTESLATSLQGELERLRYQILEIKKAIQPTNVSYWYQAVPATGTLSVGTNKVGINFSTPSFTLDVKGEAHAAVFSSTGMRVGDGGITFTQDGNVLTRGSNQADMENSSVGSIVTPNVFKSHPGTAKAWVVFVGSGTVAMLQGYNVSSVTDNAVGDYTINFTNAFSNANYICTGMATWKSGSWSAAVMQDETNLGSTTASAIRINVRDFATSTTVDAARVHVICYGDQ